MEWIVLQAKVLHGWFIIFYMPDPDVNLIKGYVDKFANM